MSKPNTPLPKYTADEIEDGQIGLCINCHDEYDSPLEPDARNIKCESCGANAVYGLSELIIMGYDLLADDED